MENEVLEVEKEIEKVEEILNEQIEQTEIPEKEICDYKKIIEALIFSTDEPLTIKTIISVLPDINEKAVEAFVEEINQEYLQLNRPFQIVKLAGGFQMVTKSEYSLWLTKVYNLRKKGRLSKPALETLAITAYKQPITKAEVEAIRGVNVDGVMNVLMEKDLIKILGRKDVPGRPIIYGTTMKFLQYFGLADLKDLPSVEEFVKNITEGEKTIGQENTNQGNPEAN